MQYHAMVMVDGFLTHKRLEMMVRVV